VHNLLLFIIGLVFVSCNKDIESRYPGICLSFDDRTVDEWFHLRELLNDNNVKVTFFITQPDSLSKTEIDKLKILAVDGHEIGFHGSMHVLSENYIKQNSYSDYLDHEINQGINSMDSLGFNCVSFAYPYGAKYWFTDLLLLQKFKFLRGVSPLNKEKDLTQIEDIYYSFDGDRTLTAIGIDNISGIDENMIDQAMERIINNKEILMLFAHSPTTQEKTTGYTFSIDLLTYIIQKANENNINFYRIQDLTKEYNKM